MDDETTSMLLDPQTIAQGEALGLMARYVVEGYMAGEHRSPFRGFSVEFTQHRQYVAGDDTRHLDWKVLGRTDRYYLKQYEQETNFVAHVLLDGSESMNYASPAESKGAGISKLEYGKRVAACLAYLVLKQRDAVAMTIFDEAVQQQVPRTGNMAAIHTMLNALAGFEAKGKTNVAGVLHEMAGQVKRRGIVVLISDLFDDEEKILAGLQHLRFAGHEVIVLHVMDPFELEFPIQGTVEFEGLEASGKLKTRPGDVRRTYMNELETFLQNVREGCEKQNCHYVLVNTSRPLHEVIGGYLAFRSRTGTR